MENATGKVTLRGSHNKAYTNMAKKIEQTNSVKKLKKRIKELEDYIRGMKDAIFLASPKT